MSINSHPDLRPRQLAEIKRLQPSRISGPYLVPGTKSRKPAWHVTASGADWARVLTFGGDQPSAVLAAAFLRGETP